MISAAPRSTGQATLITGLLGSGKTWSLASQLLQAAGNGSEPASESESCVGSGSSGSLLALGRQADCAALRQRVDLERPLGCAKCDVVTFPSLVRTIVNDFGPTIGSYTPADARVLDRSGLSVFLHRNLDALPLGKYRPLHDPGEAVRPLLDLFSGLANCGLSPEDYLRYVETLETELLETPETSATATYDEATAAASASGAAAVRAKLRAELEAEGWRAHVAGERDKANSYEAFVALKRQQGVADYSDQLLLARRVLRESAAARAALSLRLSHIYVDDLQDYSPAMVDVLSGLVAPGVGITAAADPFLAAAPTSGPVMGAENTAVARFKAAFPGALEVQLVGNRQSTDAIQVAMKALEPRPRSAPVGVKDKRTKKAKAADAKAEARDAPPPPAAAGAAGASPAASPAGGAASGTPSSSAAAVSEETASSAATVTAGGGRLTCLTFQTEEDEVRALGRIILGLIDDGVSPGDIGVAAVGGRGVADNLVAALSAMGVPAEGPMRFSGVFDHETPRVLMSFLRCLVHPSESTPLLHLLMACPAYALPGGELAAALEGHLSRYVPLRSFLRDSHLGEERETGGGDPEGAAGVSTSARNVAGRLLSDLNRFAEVAKRRGVREVMRDFLRHTGQLERLEEPTTTEEEQEGRAVGALFELAARAEKQAGGDNIALVEPILRLFRRHGAGFTDSTRFDHDDTTTPTTTDDKSEATDGGRLSSSRSGGQLVRVFQPGKDWGFAEPPSFDTVFIPFCSRARLPGNLRTPRLPVPGPFRGAPEPRDSASLRSEAGLARTGHENRARAVLYAALGAARREVCLSVSARVSRGKTHLNPSPFLFEILGAPAPREWKTAVKSSERGEREVDLLDGAVAGDAGAAAGEEAAARGVGGAGGTDAGASVTLPLPPQVPLRLSFSSISALEACPYSYYLGHVLNVSPPPNPRMVYGRAMHEGVAAFLRGLASAGGGSGGGGGPPPTLEAVVEEFNSQFSACAFESAAQVRTLRAAGVAGLESFMSRLTSGGGGDASSARGVQQQQQPRQVLVERKFLVKVPEADVVLSGIFDRVDIAPPSATGEGRGGGGGGEASSPSLLCITDYKSNVGAKDPNRMVRNNLQLQVYALAAERLFGVFPTEIAIESIEDGRRGVAVPSPADTEAALEAISAAAAAVRAEEFGATPSFQACTFCGFKNMCRHSVITRTAL